MKTKKILQITHEPIGPKTGGATLSAKIIKDILSTQEDFEVKIASAVMPGSIRNSGTSFGIDPFGNILVESNTGSNFDIDPFSYTNWLKLISEFKPDIVHLHHVKNIGIELPFLIKRYQPGTKVIFTLHDYWLICMANPMLINKDNQPCYGASPRKCSDCTNRPMGEVLNRQLFLKKGLDFVDLFLAPSRFIVSRFEDFGVPSSKIQYFPNPTNPGIEPSFDFAKTLSIQGNTINFQCLGQVLRHKGIEVLLDAALDLRNEIEAGVLSITISGSVELEYETYLRDHKAVSERLVHLTGSYENSDLERVLKEVDVLVVPSLWFENSPIVIDEAKKFGIPVIASDIGALREKVEGEGIGLNFRMGNPKSLSNLMRQISKDPSILTKFTANMRNIQPSPLLLRNLYDRLVMG